MAAVSGQVIINLTNWVFSESFGATFGSAVSLALTSTGINLSYTVGAGAKQYNNLYVASPSLTTSSSNLQLTTAGGLKNPDNTTCNFADICVLYVKNNDSTNNILIGDAASNAVSTIWGATGVQTILPGEAILIATSAATGHVVTASTADQLKIVSSASTVAADILIAGH